MAARLEGMSVSEITVPPEEKIRQRAYELYQQRLDDGREEDALKDWLQAENELKGEEPPGR